MTRTLFRGGYVHTPADPHATALCIENGQVVWVGDDDASAHFVDNADTIIELAAYANGSTASVILGFGWDESAWPEQRPPAREELDRATGGRAAFLSRVDVHSAVLSTAFLDGCPDVVHAEGYDATGRVERTAHHVARAGLFRMTPAADREAAILRALEDAARQGIGMVHELGAPHICPPEDFDIIGALTQAAVLGERPALHAPYTDADTSGHLYLDAVQVAERALPMNAFASMNKAGVALAFGSDSPVTPFAPWASVRAAAWHHTEDERITVQAAFDAHTRGGWRAARGDEGGVIAVGAPASIAVWDGADVPHLPDLHPDQDLPTCAMTLVNGEVAYEDPGVRA